MTMRHLVPLGTKLELAKRGPVKRIRFETITVRDRLDLLNASIRTVALSDGDSPVESDDRRRAYRHQRVVKGHYFRPVGIVDPAGSGVDRGDRGFKVILAQLRARGGTIEERHPFGYELLIPGGTILVEKRAQVSGSVDSCRQTRGMQTHQGCECMRPRYSAEGMLQEDCGQTH